MNKMGKFLLFFLLIFVVSLVACSPGTETGETPPPAEGGSEESPPPDYPGPGGEETPQEGDLPYPGAEEMQDQAEARTFYVGPYTADCVGVGPMTCMLVKENPDDEYSLFYDQIDGFTYEPGYTYQMDVLIEPVANPPADGSSLKYTLLELISQERALEGTNWKLDSYRDNDGNLVPAMPDPGVFMTFQEGQITGNSGCNGFGGTYTMDGNQLAIEQGMSTLMACGPAIDQQETAFRTLIDSVASYQITNDILQLMDANGEVIMEFSVLKSSGLTGTLWEVTGINNGQGAVVGVIDGTRLTAEFSSEGQISGSSGCNSYNASYEVNGANISIGMAASTMKMCAEPEGLMEQEAQYLTALQGVATFNITANTLEMRDVDGALMVSYQAAPPQNLAGTAWDVVGYNNGQEAVVSVIIGTKLTAVFDAKGNMQGFAGCNAYTASYEEDGQNIKIGPAATTRKLCQEPEGIMDQENQFLGALQTAATYSIDGPNMEMRTADGAKVAGFVEAGYVPPELTAALGNATYTSGYTADGTATLVNGEYREPAAEGSATETIVTMTENVAAGDINGELVAAVILSTDPGGSGTFYDLHLVKFVDGGVETIATTFLGDRVQINNLTIFPPNLVAVDMVTQGPEDPMSSPTQKVVVVYELQESGLVQISPEVTEE